LQIRGAKALVLEQHFLQPLGLIAEASILKEHGIEIFCTMDLDDGIVASFEDKGVSKIIYLVHGRTQSLFDARDHAAMCHGQMKGLEFYIVLIPRLLKVCIEFELN
jgi:hypothetical protein